MLKNIHHVKKEQVSEEEMEVDSVAKIGMKSEPKIESDSDSSDYDMEFDTNVDVKSEAQTDWMTKLNSNVRQELSQRFACLFTEDRNSLLVSHRRLEVYVKSSDKRVEIVPVAERKSLPFLSRYEHLKVIMMREIELQNGLPSLLSPAALAACNFNNREIAEMEVKKYMIPVTILRPVTENRYEAWRLNELIIANDLC